MKILIVITKTELGGAQMFVLNLCRALKKIGVEVVVAAGVEGFLSEELKKEGISFHVFKYLKRGINPYRSCLFIKELKGYVEDNNFTVVHLNSSNTLLGAWSLKSLKRKSNKKIKTLFTVHGLSVLDPKYKAGRVFKYIYFNFFKAAFNKIDHIVFVSKNNLDFASKSGLLKNSISKASLIYNAVDLKPDYFLTKEKARDYLLKTFFNKLEPNFFKNSFTCVSIGRLAYPKNYDFLISSFKDLKKELPNLRLVIIGSGPKKDEYQNLIKLYSLEKEIILLSELKGAAAYLKAFDVFILPSVFEGLSISLIEARLAGIPVIASLVGGNQEIISSDNCFELNNVEDLISKLKKAQQGSLKELNKEDDIFSLSKMGEEYYKLYDC